VESAGVNCYIVPPGGDETSAKGVGFFVLAAGRQTEKRALTSVVSFVEFKVLILKIL
jgi:hypothetical protein